MVLTKLPNTLILDCADELGAFRAVVCNNLDMPSLLDMTETIEGVIESLTYIAEVDHELELLAYRVSTDLNPVMESFGNEHEVHDDVYLCVIKIGEQIKNKLLSLNAYSYGHFPYIFRTIIDDRAIVLSKVLPEDVLDPYIPSDFPEFQQRAF